MIDIKELRQLAQAATPGPWKACRNHECYEGAYFEIDPEDAAEYAAKSFTRIAAKAGVVAAAHDLFEFDRGDAEFIAVANPATISELLVRLEAAEKDIALKEKIIDSLGSTLNAVAHERDALRAKIEQMEKQEPVDLSYVELMNSAQKIVESYVYFRRFIAGTPLENDIAVWMADFVFAQLDAKGE